MQASATWSCLFQLTLTNSSQFSPSATKCFEEFDACWGSNFRLEPDCSFIKNFSSCNRSGQLASCSCKKSDAVAYQRNQRISTYCDFVDRKDVSPVVSAFLESGAAVRSSAFDEVPPKALIWDTNFSSQDSSTSLDTHRCLTTWCAVKVKGS